MKIMFFDLCYVKYTSENISRTIECVEWGVESVFLGLKSLGREFDVKNMDFTTNLRSYETSNFGLFHIYLIFYWRKRVQNRAHCTANALWQSWQAFPTVCLRLEREKTIEMCVFSLMFLRFQIHENDVFATFLC